MTPMYIFIIAFVLPTGEMQINHTIVPKCPAQEEVVKVMKPMKDSGEILAWGGSCAPLIPEKEA